MVSSSNNDKVLELSHAMSSTVSAIIFLNYWPFLIKKKKVQNKLLPVEERLKAGLFTHG